MDTQDKPLSLRQRIKQLEQASNSTHLSASSPLASNPVQPQASLAALYRDPTATRVTTRSRADSLKGQLATAGTTNAVINVEPPISPTLTSIRTARAPSYTQNGAHASLAAQLSPAGGNRSRAGSTASIEGGKPTRPTFTTPSPASSRSPAPTPPPSLRRTASPAPVLVQPEPALQSFSPPPFSAVSPFFSSSNPAPKLPPRRAATVPTAALLPPAALPLVSATPILPPRPSASSPALASLAASSSPSPAPLPLPRRTPTLPSPALAAHSSVPSASRPILPSKPSQPDPLASPSRSSHLGRNTSPSVSSSASVSSPPSLPPKPSRSTSSFTSSTTATSTSHPLDPGARRRYDRLFEQCSSVSAAGRGASDEQRIEAVVVAELWRRSRLEGKVLRGIWNEAASSANASALDRGQFAKGMWLIDEELRRRQGGPVVG